MLARRPTLFSRPVVDVASLAATEKCSGTLLAALPGQTGSGSARPIAGRRAAVASRTRETQLAPSNFAPTSSSSSRFARDEMNNNDNKRAAAASLKQTRQAVGGPKAFTFRRGDYYLAARHSFGHVVACAPMAAKPTLAS